MKKKCLSTCFMMLLWWSCGEEKAEHYMVDGFHSDIPSVNRTADLFGGDARRILLENTPEEGLVGNVNKIVKSGDDFYILSDERRILHFDRHGKFLSSLDKRGGGPEEYAMLSDFDLHVKDGRTEIWLCDVNRIQKYVSDSGEWRFTGQIKFDFTVNKFRLIPGGYILLLAGQNDESLVLTDMTGKVSSRCLKKEIPFLVFKPVQFVRCDSCYVFQLGASNEGILFDTGNHTFSRTKIVNEQFLSSSELLKMYEKRGYDYLGELSHTQCIRGFRQIGESAWIDYYQNGERFVAVGRGNTWKKMKINPANDNPSVVATLGLSDAPDSFVWIEYPEDDNLNIAIYEYEMPATPSWNRRPVAAPGATTEVKVEVTPGNAGKFPKGRLGIRQCGEHTVAVNGNG
jgi:hypothetical protein